MSNEVEPGRQPISFKQLHWLRGESQDWLVRGLIGEDQRSSILGLYQTDAAIEQRRRHRAFMALCGLAALMCAAGVLLLIGYNWDEIGREAKVGMTFAAVIGAFAGSAALHRRGRPIAGEIAGFFATLLFGCGIWLLAQVYHIQAHYPDGVMWWMIGAMVAAWCLRSWLVGAEAVILLGVWAVMEPMAFNHVDYRFIPFAAVALALAYRLRSAVLVALGVVAVNCWITATGVRWGAETFILPLQVLLGCAYFSIGLLHDTGNPRGRAWQVTGMLMSLWALLPLMLTEIHHSSAMAPWAEPTRFATIAIAAFCVTPLVLCLLRRRLLAEDWPVLLAATVAGLGIIARHTLAPEGQTHWYDHAHHPYAIVLAIGYSAVGLLLSIWLILRGLRLDRSLSFFTGVVYLLIALLMRWFDLIGDMLTTSMLFFLAGGVLFAAAWFWKRHHTGPQQPISEVAHV